MHPWSGDNLCVFLASVGEEREGGRESVLGKVPVPGPGWGQCGERSAGGTDRLQPSHLHTKLGLPGHPALPPSLPCHIPSEPRPAVYNLESVCGWESF